MEQATSKRTQYETSGETIPITVAAHRIATAFIEVLTLSKPIENLLRWIPLANLARISVRVQLLRNLARTVPPDQIVRGATVIKRIDEETYEFTSRITIGTRAMVLGVKLRRAEGIGWHALETEII